MTDSINAGESIGEFRVTSVTTLHEQGETATMLVHGPTGLRWLHFNADDPVSSCAIAVVTPLADDCGLPHVLEHMIFEGSKRCPGMDLMRGMANRTVTEEMNGATFSFMTEYRFSSAVESDMRGIFEVWFDAILRPELSDAAFFREAGRFMPKDASHPEGPLAYTGVVFNEMRGERGDLSDRIIHKAARHLVPDNGFGFAPGGRPADIMSLTPDDIRAYHARWYCPANMRVITRGREVPRALLAIADRLLEGVEAGEAAPPFAPQPRWEEPRAAVIEMSAPESATNKDKMPNQGILWLLPDTTDFRASLALDLFLEEADLCAVMDKALGESEDKFDWERTFKTVSDQLGPDKVWGICGRLDPDDQYETLWDRTARELRKLLDNPKTAQRVGSAATARAEHIANPFDDGGLAELARRDGFKTVFHNWILRDDPFFGLVSSRHLAACQKFARDPGSALAIVRDLLLANPHRLDLSIREVRNGEDSESAAIAISLEEERDALSDEDCRALAAREVGLAASLSMAPSGEPLPETTLDDIPDDRLAIPCKALKANLCGATFLALGPGPSGEAWLAGFADLSDLTSEQFLMVPLIVETFRGRARRGRGRDSSSPTISIGPYACTGLLDGVQKRGLKFMVKLDNENLELVARHFDCLFRMRDPLSYERARRMVVHATGSVKVSQDHLRDGVWATCATADESLLKACSDCRALEEVIAYRASCALPCNRDEMGKVAVGFVREASEVADMLHNPARWTFAFAGPEHLTAPTRDALLATLLSAPARPIGHAAELKFAPKELCEEGREAKSVPGSQVASVSVSIPALAHSTLLRWRLELGARLLERDFVVPRIRKGLGAYGAKISWRGNALRLESSQNPDVRDTLGLIRSLRDFVADVEWTADDVRQAALALAARFVNVGLTSYSMVSRCLDDGIRGMKPSRIRDGLKRVAETKPDSIREALLEALDAGIGRETVHVEASEEAIAEANSRLPENQRLHVMGPSPAPQVAQAGPIGDSR